jgi:hypothetical protein
MPMSSASVEVEILDVFDATPVGTIRTLTR